MKKRLVGIALCIALLFVGCNNQVETEKKSSSSTNVKNEQQNEVAKKTKIKFLGWTEQKQDAMEKLIAAFEAKEPNIEVELELLDPKQYGDIVMARLAAGEASDVMAVSINNVDIYGEAGYLSTIDKNEGFIKDIKPGIAEKGMYKGEIKMLPVATDSFGFYYNKDLFKELGLEIPKSYPQLLEICKKIKESGKTAIAMPGKEVWAPQFVCLGLWGEVYEKLPTFFDDTKDGKVKYSDYPEFLNGFKRFEELTPYYSKDALGIDWANAQREFYTGEAAMIASGTWMLNDVRKANPDFEVGFISIPYSTEPQDVFNTQGGYTFCVSVPESSEYKEEAMKFIRFLLGEYYEQYLTDTQFSGSVVKGVIPKFDPILEDFDKTFASTNERIFEPSVQNVYFKGLQEIIQGTKTPEQIVSDMDDAQERALE